jgi:RNA polymerase sigma-70 factor, ECF subfamily
VSGSLAHDRALVERILEDGDERAFRELYRRHSPSLLAMAGRLCDHGDDVDDVVHDTWVRAVEILDRFAWRSAFKTWITGVLVNCVRERRRSLPRDTSIDDVELPAEEAPVLPRSVDRMDLDRAIGGLPDGYRQVLVLHDLEGFTHDEIGAILSIEPGTSKSQLWRARRSLRRTLGTD